MIQSTTTPKIQGLFNGIGQVYFSSSLYSSVIILIAFTIESAPLALMTVFGGSISHLFSKYSHNITPELTAGLYSLNGALIGLFIGNFFGVSHLLAWGGVALGAILTVPIAHCIYQFQTYRGYTSAFVLSGWGLFTVITHFEMMPLAQTSITQPVDSSFLSILFKSISQVAFIENEVTGVLIFAAVLMVSKKSALWMLLAPFIAATFSTFIGADEALISKGLCGYNAILVSLALLLISQVNWSGILLGVVTSCLITWVFHQYQLLPLTAPFILSTWFVVYCRNRLGRYCSIKVQGSDSK